MTKGFWLEVKTCDFADAEDETKGTDLLGLATEVFQDDTEERKFL